MWVGFSEVLVEGFVDGPAGVSVLIEDDDKGEVGAGEVSGEGGDTGERSGFGACFVGCFAKGF